MKSLADLQAIRAKTLENINMRKEDSNAARVVIGMATCGIAAGAQHTALRRYMSGPVYLRAMQFIDRWGPWAIPFCFLTVGVDAPQHTGSTVQYTGTVFQVPACHQRYILRQPHGIPTDRHFIALCQSSRAIG